MKKSVIGVDLDEVLAELLDYILEYNGNKIGSHYLKREEVKDYYIHKMENIDVTIEEAIDWFRNPMFEDVKKCEIPAVTGAKEKLIELKNSGFSLVVLTARIEEIFGEYTRSWVDAYFPGIFDKIIFADHFHKNHKDKSELCRENNISYMIEDNYDYALDLANSGIKTFLLEKPWNNWQQEYHDNIIRIGGWDELEIEKKN